MPGAAFNVGRGYCTAMGGYSPLDETREQGIGVNSLWGFISPSVYGTERTLSLQNPLISGTREPN